MRFTANTDLKELAKRVLDAVKDLEAKTRAELAKIDENNDLRQEAKTEQRQAVLDTYKTEFKNLRAELGGKADAAIREIRKLADMVPTPAASPEAVNTLQLLKMAPSINAAMIEQAAQSIGDDLQAREILMQIAQQNGLGAAAVAALKPVKPRLTKQGLDDIAQEVSSSFMQFFDARAEYPDELRQWEHPFDKFLNGAERSNSAARITDISNGAAFAFDGNSEVKAAFDGLASSAEL